MPTSLGLAVFFYLLSGQPLGFRDPTGTSLAWYIYVELALFVVSVTIAAVEWRRYGVALNPSTSFWLFFTFGLLALLFSFRSFWPPLSIVQGCLFCGALILAELLCTTFSPPAVLRATYYGVVSLFIVAILTAIVFPSAYPLSLGTESDRHRLVLFENINGEFAYMTGLAVFIGRLPAVRASWYFQLFLVVLTIASGSRASTAALIIIWLAVQLYEARHRGRLLAICTTVGVSIAVGAALGAHLFSGFAAIIHRGLQPFYGSEALSQSGWELSGRVQLWDAAAGTFANSMFAGFGFAGARDQLLRAMDWAGGAHNGFLELLLTAGGAGLLSFLAGWFYAIRSSFGSRTGRSSLAIHCFLLVTAIAAPSFTMFRYFGVFVILCTHYWAVGVRAIEWERKRRGMCQETVRV